MGGDQDGVDFYTWQQLAGEMAALPSDVVFAIGIGHTTRSPRYGRRLRLFGLRCCRLCGSPRDRPDARHTRPRAAQPRCPSASRSRALLPAGRQYGHEHVRRVTMLAWSLGRYPPVVTAEREGGTHEGEPGELPAAGNPRLGRGGDPQASPFGRLRPNEGCPGPCPEVAHQ